MAVFLSAGVVSAGMCLEPGNVSGGSKFLSTGVVLASHDRQ